MDSRINEIITGLQRLLKTVENSFIAKVVNDKADTVDVEDLNGTKYNDVRKIATQGTQGIIFRLKKDSYIIVSRISGSDELFVSMMSEIEKIEIIVDEIVINDGKNDGLVKVKSLTGKINDIEDQVNNLLTTLQGVSVALAPSGTFPFAPIFSGFSPLVKTQQSEIENEKIKH